MVNPDLQIAINWLKNDRPNSAWAMRYDPTFDRVVNYIYYSQKEYEKAVAAEQAQKERGFNRITSYNVCYTKLLRYFAHSSISSCKILFV